MKCQTTGQVAVQVLQFCDHPRKAGEIQDFLGVKHRQTFRENYLNVFLSKGWLKRTIPKKPKSRLQRYQTTPEGNNWLQTALTGLVAGGQPRQHEHSRNARPLQQGEPVSAPVWPERCPGLSKPLSGPKPLEFLANPHESSTGQPFREDHLIPLRYLTRANAPCLPPQ